MRTRVRVGVGVLLTLGLVLAGITPAEGSTRAVSGSQDCDAESVGVETIPETPAEFAYNEDLTVCDWGEGSDQAARFSFTNHSPVIWFFYDTLDPRSLPKADDVMYYTPTGTPAGFRRYAVDAEIMPTEWFFSPGETVWLESASNVSFGIASPLVNSSWLLFSQQTAKISSLSKAYAKRLFVGKKSKTRTFLWDCVTAGISGTDLLDPDGSEPVIKVAGSWLSAASEGGECAVDFKRLFAKKSSTLPSSTTKVAKWFNPSSLQKAGVFLEEVEASRTAMAVVNDLIRVVH